ncbi:amino acid/polyamine/organocation transporter (APC superfamily) [Bifidobacterium psychraerophilum DSM 22366]|uniref:Amino acid permease, purative n=2 Tax=Bifidobacterium psychraerophilum TaxID=218140 RepID=A0A087CD21_9BIFI|nr:amino acid permease, purative [Bifidobacterium psychraerophilum]PKA95514.1 amino acid/polyamine/organocation transporter (APC superfamily) [Bifidobacterium psychraerophilum DSM 22366]
MPNKNPSTACDNGRSPRRLQSKGHSTMSTDILNTEPLSADNPGRHAASSSLPTPGTTSNPPPESSSSTRQSLSGSLGVGAIVFMVVAAAAPLTVIGGGAPVGILLGNGAGFPSTYIVAGIALALFSVGLSAMARFVPKAGAFFAYIGRGLNPTWGLGAAMLALVSYTAIQVSVYCLIGLQISVALEAFSISLPWWAYSLMVLALTAFLGYRHIDMSSKVLGVLLIAEIAVILVLSLAIFATGGASGIHIAQSFSPQAFVSGSPGVAFMFGIASFIGFESTAIYRSEAKNPDRTIPRATYIACAFASVLYVFASWALVTAWGPDSVVEVAGSTLEAGNMLQLTGERYIGSWYAVVISVLLITSLFACILSFHNVLARYMHAMGSSKALPAFLAHTHRKHHSPARASLAQSATALLALGIIVLSALDPYAQGFTWFSGVATAGFVTLMLLTCAAVIAFFAKNRDLEAGIWQTRVAPGLGGIILAVFLMMIVVNFPLLVGDSDAAGNPKAGALTYGLLGLLLVFFLAGVAQAIILRLRRPQSYEELTDGLAG